MRPAAVFVLLAMAGPAHAAEIMTVGDLQEFCSASDDGDKGKTSIVWGVTHSASFFPR